MNFRNKAVLCTLLVAVFALQMYGNGSLTSKQVRQQQLPVGAHLVDSSNTTFIPTAKVIKHIYVLWTINTNDWRKHQPDWEVAVPLQEDQQFCGTEEDLSESVSQRLQQYVYTEYVVLWFWDRSREDRSRCASYHGAQGASL
jgi:hypothetical protein